MVNVTPGLAAVACVAAVLGACALRTGTRDVHVPTAGMTALQPGAAVENWPHSPEVLEHELAFEAASIHASKPLGAGVTGAFVAIVCFGSAEEVHKIKWKEVPRGDADGWNNSPRKELAAYAIQRWFLDPKDYVVPTTVARCIPLEAYRSKHPDAEPTIKGTRCVLGLASIWLQNVTIPDELYAGTRFAADWNYAYHMANFNILAYLIDHSDGRSGNFLVSTDPANRRVYAVDNGISFGALVYNYFVRNWNDIRVPALPHTSVERLRSVAGTDLEGLGVVLQMRADKDGILQPVEPGPNLDPSKGARVTPGMIQLGLTDSEIEDVAERLQKLIAEVDKGDMPEF